MLRILFFLISTIFFCSSWADDVPSWTNQNIFRGSGLTGIPARNPIPDFVGMSTNTNTININGGWVNTNIAASQGKLLQFDWTWGGVNPRKYLILFRADYRFDAQPMLIYEYDYQNATYKPDYLNYSNTDLSTILPANATSTDKITRIGLLNDYMSMKARGVQVQEGDIVNILLVNTFTNAHPSFSEIGTSIIGSVVPNLYELNSRLPSGMSNNSILNMSADEFCRYSPNLQNFAQVCVLNPDTKIYTYKPSVSINTIVSGLLPLVATIPKCNTSSSNDYAALFASSLDYIAQNYTVNSQRSDFDRWLVAADNHLRNYFVKDDSGYFPNSFSKARLPQVFTLWTKDLYPYLYKWFLGDNSCAVAAKKTALNYCLNDVGQGLQISVNTEIIKNAQDIFVPVTNPSTNYVYTAKINNAGMLTISFVPQVNPQSQNSFLSFEPKLSITDARGTGVAYMDGLSMTGLQFGRYLMEVNVGGGGASAVRDFSSLKYEYYIQPIGGSIPSVSTQGLAMSSSENRFNAIRDGSVWVRVISSNRAFAGTVNVKTSAYRGSQALSTGINNYIVQPVLGKYAKVMRSIYDGPTGLVNNYTIKTIVKTMATIYIMLYGIYFLMGSVQMTASDLLVRIAKIIVVVNVLFSANSWEFFNDNLFGMMLNGTNYLINVFTGATGSVSNPFSFLDPVFNTYTSPGFWLAILVQLIQVWNGLGLLALLVIAGVTLFFATLIEIVMTYILSFIVIYILIALAPIFIPFMLFSATKQFFANWLSIIFKNMLLPVVFIVLILIFDHFMSGILTSTILGNSWGCLQKIKITIPLGSLNLDLVPESLGLCLPFFIPEIDQVSVTSVAQGIGIAAQQSVFAKALTFLNVAMASFLYLTYALVARQLLNLANSILGRITGLIYENAAASVASNIKENSVVGRMSSRLSGNEMMNRYVERRSPFNYQDNVEKRAVTAAKATADVGKMYGGIIASVGKKVLGIGQGGVNNFSSRSGSVNNSSMQNHNLTPASGNENIEEKRSLAQEPVRDNSSEPIIPAEGVVNNGEIKSEKSDANKIGVSKVEASQDGNLNADTQGDGAKKVDVGGENNGGGQKS